ESRSAPRAAQPSRRERFAAGLQTDPQRWSKVEAGPVPGRPPATRQAHVQPAHERSGGIAPGAPGARQGRRIRAPGLERAVARAREKRRLFEIAVSGLERSNRTVAHVWP